MTTRFLFLLASLSLAFPAASLSQGWQPLLPDLDIGGIRLIAADESGHVWLYGSDGRLYSLPEGTDRVDTGRMIDGSVLSLRARTDHLLAIIRKAPNPTLIRSVDSGASWSSIPLTLPNGLPAAPQRILVDDDGRFYLACSYGHLFQEVPGSMGDAWRFYAQLPYQNRDSLLEVFSLAGRDSSLIVTVVDRTLRNGGVVNDVLIEGPRSKWRSISPSDAATADWTVARTVDGTILVTTAIYGAHGFVYRSRDEGKTWDTLDTRVRVQVYEPEPPMAVSRTGSVAYAAPEGLRYSNDGGESFRVIDAAVNVHVTRGADDRLRAHFFALGGRHEIVEENAERTDIVRRLKNPILMREGSRSTSGHVRSLVFHQESTNSLWYAVADENAIYEWTPERPGWRRLLSPPTDSITTLFREGDDLYVGGTAGLFRLRPAQPPGWDRVVADPVRQAVVGGDDIAMVDNGSGSLYYHFLADSSTGFPPQRSPAAMSNVRLLGKGPNESLVIIGPEGVSLLPLLSDRWRTIPLPVAPDLIRHVELESDSVIVCSEDVVLWASQDAGSTWHRSVLGTDPVLELARGYATRYHNRYQETYHRFVAMTASGVWNSDDSGKSWISIVDNLPTTQGYSAFAFGLNMRYSLMAIDDHGLWGAGPHYTTSVAVTGEADSNLHMHYRDGLLRVVVPGTDLEIEACDVRGQTVYGIMEATESGSVTHGTWQTKDPFRGLLFLQIRSSHGTWFAKAVR